MMSLCKNVIFVGMILVLLPFGFAAFLAALVFAALRAGCGVAEEFILWVCR